MVPAGFPCCLPCSCLPTCSQRHNCCPKIGYQTEDVPHTETEMYKTTRDEDFATGNSTGQTTDKPSTITRAKIKRIREDQPDQETKVERHSDDTHYAQTLRDDYTDSEQENGVEPICFKPQVLNRPNWYLDSDAYVMIAACRETFKDTEIKDKCEAGMNKTSISDMLPVTSRLTGLAYVNKFCLLCNEPIDPSPIFDFWKAKFVNVGALHPMYLVFNPNEYIDVLLENGNIHFAPVASYPVHQCENYAITSCNQTGLWESHDEMMEDICHHGHNLPILHNAMRFKNIACLHCNEGDSFDGILSCGFWVSLDTAARNYSLTLNIRDTAPDGKTEKGLIHESYLTQAVLQLPKAQRCPAGYIALLVRHHYMYILNEWVQHIFVGQFPIFVK